MASQPIDGQQKYLNFKAQFGRLNRALKNEFYLEAIFIEYAIIEDRTESALRHAELWDAYLKRRGKNMVTITSKIKFIQEKSKNEAYLLHNYFSGELWSQILAWKDKRNPLIHELLNQKLGPDDLKNLAEEGAQLARTLRDKVGYHKRAMAKKKAGHNSQE